MSIHESTTMSADQTFTDMHVSSVAARAAELERLAEDQQDPEMFVRAARLYALAVRIVDDIERREALPFMQSDLARVRDELQALVENDGTDKPRKDMRRAFREIVAGIEHRLSPQ
jgi:hypothetical protein